MKKTIGWITKGRGNKHKQSEIRRKRHIDINSYDYEGSSRSRRLAVFGNSDYFSAVEREMVVGRSK